ncbi:MAG: site-2 protease family protein, partial [Candidatus Aminicenantes bacterium]|nr:site-2 protease family protein [Candidatus Aminicenantes bacterium]
MEEETLDNKINQSRLRTFFAKPRIWVNVLLFLITVVTTYFFGLSWSVNYYYTEVLISNEEYTLGPEVFTDPKVLSLSFIYVVALLGILLAHEMGHYLACRYYHVDATLPYFIPAPTIIGTMGAFIKIRSPITQKRQLFDIGIAGPLAGFVLAVPCVIYGLYHSKLVPPLPAEGSIVFGEPLLLVLIGNMIFSGSPETFDLILHPVAFAGWVGMLVTALNLFPISQLDGGHVAYAVIGKKAKILARIVFYAFLIMGVVFWIGWFIWALIIFFIGMRHPRIYDEEIPLSPARKWIAVLAVIIFILS